MKFQLGQPQSGRQMHVDRVKSAIFRTVHVCAALNVFWFYECRLLPRLIWHCCYVPWRQLTCKKICSNQPHRFSFGLPGPTWNKFRKKGRLNMWRTVVDGRSFRSVVWTVCGWLLRLSLWQRAAVFALWLQTAGTDQPAILRPRDRPVSQLSARNDWRALPGVRHPRRRRRRLPDVRAGLLGTRLRRLSRSVFATEFFEVYKRVQLSRFLSSTLRPSNAVGRLCESVCPCIYLSGQWLSNKMTFDLNIWYGALSWLYLDQVHLSGL